MPSRGRGWSGCAALRYHLLLGCNKSLWELDLAFRTARGQLFLVEFDGISPTEAALEILLGGESIKSLGFNTVRVPFSNEMLRSEFLPGAYKLFGLHGMRIQWILQVFFIESGVIMDLMRILMVFVRIRIFMRI